VDDFRIAPVCAGKKIRRKSAEERHPSMTNKSIFIVLFVCYLLPLAAYAGDFPKFEIYGAYSFMRVSSPEDSVILSPSMNTTFSISGNSSYQHPGGLKAGIGFNLNQHFGFVGEFGWNRSRGQFLNTSIRHPPCESTYCPRPSYSSLQNEQSRENVTLLAGPRLSMNLTQRFRPFAQVLAGWRKNSATLNQSYYTSNLYDGTANITMKTQNENSFSIAGGGGLDMKLNNQFSLRLFEIDVLTSREVSRQYSIDDRINYANGYTRTGTQTAFGHPGGNWTSAMRFSFGALFHLGNAGK
jgi:hypothetical protein